MDEKQLIKSCLRGGTEEFKRIVDIYAAPAMALAMNILRNREDAEDACQETFLQVYRHLDRLDLRKDFKNWLYTVIYRRCLDQIRRRRRAFRLFQKMKGEPSLSVNKIPSNAPGELPLHENILRHLTARERAALWLWANEDLPSEEIAEVLKCSSSTARVYLFNARRKIKALMEKKNASLPRH